MDAINNQDNINIAESTTESTVLEVQNSTSEQSVSKSFLDSLPDDLKTDKSLSKFTSLEDLAKSYKNLNTMLGKRVSELTPDELKSLEIKQGKLPESPEKYQFADDLKNVDVSWYKNAAFEAGLSQEQAKVIADKYVEFERNMMAQMQEKQKSMQEQAISSLKAEFGSAFEQRIEIAKKAVDVFGGQDLKQYLNETGLGNDPRVIKTFERIGKELLEDTVINSDKDNRFGVTPAEAQSRIDAKFADPSFRDAYFSARHPGHKTAVQEMAKLFELKNG